MSLDTIVITEQDFERLSLLLQHTDSEQADLLGEELSRATVVKAEEIASTIVTMNSKVLFIDTTTKKPHEFTLVYPKDADLNQNKISVLAPIGMALLGLKVGQSIDWPLPNGSTKRIQIEKILYQPEALGHWNL